MVSMNYKYLVWKYKKIGLFSAEKGYFLPVTEKIGTPNLHKNCIRGLENSIDLKIGMHVP